VARALAGLALAGGLGALVPTAAQADTSLDAGSKTGMSTRLFHAAVDSKGFFSVNGTDVLGAGDVAFGLVLDGGFGLLRLRDPATDETGATLGARSEKQLINSQFHGVLFVSYSPIQNLTIGLGIPTDLVSGNPQATGQAAPGTRADQKTDVNAFFSGQWSLNLKYRFMRVEDQPIGLAAIVQVEGLAGEDARLGYAADPGVAITPMLAVEKRLGGSQRFRIGANLGASIITGTGAKIGDLAAGDAGKVLQHGTHGRFGVGISYRPTDEVDLVAETYGSYLFKNDAGGTAGLSTEAVGGIKIFVERNSYLFLGGGVGYMKGYQAANYRGFLGFIFEPSIGDRDGDGIKDDIDQCPDDPEDKDGFQDADGCPDPDNDKDGIPDKRDACPNDPETMNGVADEDGCPDGIDGDRDKDGIKDSVDKCPDDPEDKDGFQDEDGCPDPDNDNDGIKDVDDKCPMEPEDKDGFQDEDGCPDPDNDHDGILDVNDKCPNEPETFNGFEDEDGCPDKGRVIIEGSSIVILDKIEFVYDRADIVPKSLPIIDAVASTLKAHPEFELVYVEGHADNRGDDNYNLQLSQRRVEKVVQELVKKGVDAKRLKARGYGEYCPLVNAENEDAWARNRRVEFKIVKTNGALTGVALGCDAAAKKNVKPEPVQ
jgi:outer membrane protein OmpA-like peptidoglycan-associated protein